MSLEEALTDGIDKWESEGDPKGPVERAVLDVLRSLADGDGLLVIDTRTGDVLRAERVTVHGFSLMDNAGRWWGPEGKCAEKSFPVYRMVRPSEESTPCAVCDGEGEWELEDGQLDADLECPSCAGTGVSTQGDKQ